MQKSYQANAPRHCKQWTTEQRQTERQHLTAPTQKAGFRASYDSFLVNQTLVFQIKFCGESPALRVAAKRQTV